MNIEFYKGMLLQSMVIDTQLSNKNLVDFKKLICNDIDKKKCLRKTITALTKDGYIIPTSTFGSTYTLNFERINQIQFK
jgi:hypothetical protein